MRVKNVVIRMAALSAAAMCRYEAAAEVPPWSVVGCDRMSVAVLEGDTPRFILHGNLTGPGWKGGRLSQLAEVQGKSRVYAEEKVGFYKEWWDKQPMPGLFDLRYELEQTAPNRVRMRYVCVPDSGTTFGFPKGERERSVTIGPLLRPEPYFQGGTCTFRTADGKTEDVAMPVPMSGRQGVAAVTLKTASGETTRLLFNPPLFVHCDHSELRCFSGTNTAVKAGETFTQEVVLELPHPVAFEPGNRYVDMKGWFPLDLDRAGDFAAASVLGMESWLDKPAGKRGYVQVKGKDFVFEDGTRAKFWGVNQCCRGVCPEIEQGVKWADKWAKHGVNLVRMHKFVGHGWKNSGIHDNGDTRKLDEEMARRWDAYNAALAARGIYTGWSPFYALKLTEADRDRVWAYDEILRTKDGPPWYHASTVGLVNFAPDLQDLHIAILSNLLHRVNTVTGRRYADDPSLAYIEIQNEDDIFFGYQKLMDACPTYRSYLNARFSEWLLKKYGSRDALAKAWDGKLEANERLDAPPPTPSLGGVNVLDLETDKTQERFRGGNVAAITDSWRYGGDAGRRVQDSYAFLYECQDAYYKRVAKAIRDTGYKGAICGSCWQAQTFLGHLYNTRSDREVGFVDRHNYGGGDMLSRPGRGLLSAGMQQVADRPYNFSEWAGGGVFESLEMVPVIGFIGMGVQGWDMSCHFASNSPEISRKPDGNVCDRFMSLAQYPAVARALYRGDFVEADPVAVRRVSIPGMATGQVGFSEQFSLLGGANIKEFSAAVPQEALAVGPVVVEFVDGPVAAPVEDRTGKLIDVKAGTLTSASGQVKWDYAGRGFFTVDTPGTQGLVGFGGGHRHQLKDVAIQTANAPAFVYVSARDRGETIANAKALVITTLGRLYHEGSVVDEVSMGTIRPAENLEAASQMVEPIAVTIELRRQDACRVFALDHGGRKPGSAREVPVEKTEGGCRFVLDGSSSRSMHYAVEFVR